MLLRGLGVYWARLLITYSSEINLLNFHTSLRSQLKNSCFVFHHGFQTPRNKKRVIHFSVFGTPDENRITMFWSIISSFWSYLCARSWFLDVTKKKIISGLFRHGFQNRCFTLKHHVTRKTHKNDIYKRCQRHKTAIQDKKLKQLTKINALNFQVTGKGRCTKL